VLKNDFIVLFVSLSHSANKSVNCTFGDNEFIDNQLIVAYLIAGRSFSSGGSSNSAILRRFRDFFLSKYYIFQRLNLTNSNVSITNLIEKIPKFSIDSDRHPLSERDAQAHWFTHQYHNHRKFPNIVILQNNLTQSNHKCYISNVDEIMETVRHAFPHLRLDIVTWFGMPLIDQIGYEMSRY
jgi:hypothetical protein